MHPSLANNAKNAIPLHAVRAKDAKAWLARQKRAGLVSASGFAGALGTLAALPDARGGIAAWVLGLGYTGDAFALAAAAEKLPAGVYRLGEVPYFCGGANAALAWTMGGYGFARYRKTAARKARLVLPKGVDGEDVSRIAEIFFWRAT